MSVADDGFRDLKYAVRLHLRSSGFTLVVLVTLAVAIGATVTVFSIVDAWLIKPLNFPHANRLAIAFGARPERPNEPQVWLPYREYLEWKERSHSFESVSAAFLRDVTITSATDESALGMSVTPEFFGTLGVGPLLGRTIEERDMTGPPAVVLSYGLWQRHFGRSDRVIGASIMMSGVPHDVLGVMPRDFDTRMLDMRFEFWTPLRRGESGYADGGPGPMAIIGRLRDGVTIDAARAESARLMRDTESRYQPNLSSYVATVSSLQEDNTRTVRSTLLTVATAVVGLLLISAMNVGTLILGRGLSAYGRPAFDCRSAAAGCG